MYAEPLISLPPFILSETQPYIHYRHARESLIGLVKHPSCHITHEVPIKW